MGNEFEEISGDTLLTIEKLKKPIEGIYTGTKLLDKGFAYIIKTSNGSVELADCTDLNKKMSKLNEGDSVRITNAGKTRTSNGREMFLSKVEVAIPTRETEKISSPQI